MIAGIGIDTIDIDRCKHWPATYKATTLKRLYTQQELAYCLAIPAKQAERLAGHLAAKEAFYKALSLTQFSTTKPLIALCKNIEIRHAHSGAPILVTDLVQQPFVLHLSITHTQLVAQAIVIIEKP